MPANDETHGERVVVSPSTVRSLGLCSLGGMSLSTFLWAPSGDPSFSFILHDHILSQHWELCPAWEKQTSENHFLLVKGWDSRPGYFKSQVGESVLLLQACGASGNRTPHICAGICLGQLPVPVTAPDICAQKQVWTRFASLQLLPCALTFRLEEHCRTLAVSLGAGLGPDEPQYCKAFLGHCVHHPGSQSSGLYSLRSDKPVSSGGPAGSTGTNTSILLIISSLPVTAAGTQSPR